MATLLTRPRRLPPLRAIPSERGSSLGNSPSDADADGAVLGVLRDILARLEAVLEGQHAVRSDIARLTELLTGGAREMADVDLLEASTFVRGRDPRGRGSASE
jgi:hypothetical protein